MTPSLIGYGRQSIDASDIAAVTTALQADSLTRGPMVERFEQELCRVTGAAHAIAVSNGTSALRLLYQAVGIGPGKRVGVPTMTFMATASQAMLLGADIVLLDVDPQTLCLTPEILERCRERLDFVVPVHFAGRLCDLAGLAAVAAKRGITLIDDAAHSFGSTWDDGQTCGDGTFSKGTTLSFHPVKNITTGEGGAVLTNDPAIASRVRLMRHHGINYHGFHGPLAGSESDGAWYLEFHEPATNERITDFQCALGISQMKRLESFKQARAAIVERYRRELPGLAPVAAPGQQPFWHLCVAQVDWAAHGTTRAQAFRQAKADGFGFMVHYIPLHQQPLAQRMIRPGSFPGADAAYPRMASIPCYPDLTADQQAQVIAWFRKLGAG